MRIVSLLPSATEIVAALGALDQLVGVTHACDYPPQIAHLPRLTSTHVDGAAPPDIIDRDVRAAAEHGTPLYDLNDTLLASLRPNVIVTQALCNVCAVRETDVRAVAERLSPAPRVVTLSGTSIDGIFRDIACVANAIDVPDEAEELIAGLRTRLRHVHDRLRGARAPRPRVAVLEWTDPVFTAGHWVPENGAPRRRSGRPGGAGHAFSQHQRGRGGERHAGGAGLRAVRLRPAARDS